MWSAASSCIWYNYLVICCIKPSAQIHTIIMWLQFHVYFRQLFRSSVSFTRCLSSNIDECRSIHRHRPVTFIIFVTVTNTMINVILNAYSHSTYAGYYVQRVIIWMVQIPKHETKTHFSLNKQFIIHSNTVWSIIKIIKKTECEWNEKTSRTTIKLGVKRSNFDHKLPLCSKHDSICWRLCRRFNLQTC